MRMIPCALVLLLAFLVQGAPARGSTAATQPITLQDLGGEVGLEEIALSPDGKRIAIVTSVADYTDNRFVKSLVLVDTATGGKRALMPNRQSVGAPRWSPAGDRLAYLDTEQNGTTQLYVLAIAADGPQTAVRVTDSPRGVRAYRWSPDGTAFAYLASDAPFARTGEERHNKSFDAGEDDYLATAPAVPVHLWWISATRGEARRLTSGVRSFVDLEWTKDGRRIVYVVQPGAHFADFRHKSLGSLDVASGGQSVLDAGPAAFDHSTGISLSPDGRLVSFQYYPGPEPLFHPTRVALVPPAGGSRRDVSPSLDRTVVLHAWSRDSRSLLMIGVERTRHVAWLQSVTSDTRKRVDLGPVTAVSALAGSASGALAFIGSEPQRPPELYFMASPDRKPERLTGFNDALASLHPGRIETLVWKGPDGFELDGVVTHPPGFTGREKSPLVLNLHGGPMFASSESWNGFDQLLAAQGWIVFAPNYRGSTSTGDALQSAIINDAGEGPGRDVMSGIEVLKARGLVDETRMAVSGWSYGGYMTAWLIGRYPVWRAAVSGATVTDWLDYYNLSDANVWAGYGIGGSPWLNGNTDNYWRQSPISLAHRARTPTLILANTGDRRVTISQSYKLYHALKDNGVEVSFIAYPVDAHVPIDPVHERDVRRRWVDWIDRHFRAP